MILNFLKLLRLQHLIIINNIIQKRFESVHFFISMVQLTEDSKSISQNYRLVLLIIDKNVYFFEVSSHDRVGKAWRKSTRKCWVRSFLCKQKCIFSSMQLLRHKMLGKDEGISQINWLRYRSSTISLDKRCFKGVDVADFDSLRSYFWIN